MKVVYVAGPFRASNAWMIEQNIRAAEGYALRLWRIGFAVLCPHTNTRFFDGAADDSIWLRGDLEMLSRCDAVFAIPGWQKSSGARAEIEYADELGIPVYFTFDEIRLCKSMRQPDRAGAGVKCDDVINAIQKCPSCSVRSRAGLARQDDDWMDDRSPGAYPVYET